ncbi:hypothetical protein L1987_86973 [Smallanthus sonchifolius]|uniref:Uncharacterized protein n=1 Tax=Smallanthus sonchifolius TaxID=185202 RepID=A0ACB8Y0X0_9ASTR|nr:hypothetical protein L1987_86973 [Smallanthus sonchifolius]
MERVVIIMGLFVFVGVKYALADVGTATSYDPPYTRKYVDVCILILFKITCFVNSNDTKPFDTNSTHEALYLNVATRCNGNQADQFPSGNLFISVSEGLWDNGAACGRRYRLKCLSGSRKPCKDGTIDVRVVDYCSKTPCPSTIVLSNDAFSAISKSQRGKINVEYVQI